MKYHLRAWHLVAAQTSYFTSQLFTTTSLKWIKNMIYRSHLLRCCLLAQLFLLAFCLCGVAENNEQRKTSGNPVFPGWYAGLTVTALGTLAPELPAEDDHRGTAKKWSEVREILSESAEQVIIKQTGCDLGGNTSVRNSSPMTWKESGYFRRARDLGQVFTAPHDFTLDSIVLRTGNAHLCFLPGSAGAEVFVQFFEVHGTPTIDDNGTPPGSDATHGFSKNHRCDDYVSGVEYKPLCVVSGGRLPNLLQNGDGKLTYMKWSISDELQLEFKAGKQYAFMVGFVEPGPERNFTLGNRNNASSPAPPAIADTSDHYGGGWGLRREGNGVRPPRMVAGPAPPTDSELLQQLETESTFPLGKARYSIPPTCDGYPDVDTYRDLEFYIVERR